MSRLDKEQVAAALSAERVFDFFAVDRKRSAGQWRIQHCPECGPRSRKDAVTVSDDGKWHCKAHGCRGDIFTMVGGFAGIDVKSRFPEVLTLAAEIAGVDGEPDPKLAERLAAQKREREQREQVKRLRATEEAQRLWKTLAPRSPQGEAYMEGRSLAPWNFTAALPDDMTGKGIVRFGRHAVCTPLYDVDGGIVNIVARSFDNREPKIRSLPHCSTMAVFGNPTMVGLTAGPILVVEGMFDFLSAMLLWDGALVLGAHGCAQLGFTGGLAGELASRHGRGVRVVPHNDKAGRVHGRKAADAAINAGVAAEDVEFYELESEYNDLNDYLCKKAG